MTDYNYLKSLFFINPEITYFNFGSHGACPKPVFEDYQRWQLELESDPFRFFTVNGPEYLKKSRQALAAYLNCHPDDVVYVSNPTYGANIVAKSFPLKPGDEVLTTDLEYGAIDRTWDYYCRKSNAKLVRSRIELPLLSKEKFIEQFFSGLSERTVAILISHLTSSTALIFPVKEICEIAKRKGLFTMVDGAHACAQIPVDLSGLNADFYTGACHKWMMTPKGNSFLYVKRDLQPMLDPLVISWGYNSATPSHSQFIDYHQLQGTRDYSAFLTTPKAIEFMRENNWEEVSARCRKLLNEHAGRICEVLSSRPLAPLTDEFIAQMLSIPVKVQQPEKMQEHLFRKFKIEIPFMRHGENVYMRISIQAFNHSSDLEKLENALKEIINEKELAG